jgi:hypothetical protein
LGLGYSHAAATVPQIPHGFDKRPEGCVKESTRGPKEIAVDHGMEAPAAAERPGESVDARTGGRCAKCGSHKLRRVERKGFLQKKVYSFFGYYPWRCSTCRTRFLLRKRDYRASRKKDYTE